MQGKCVIFLLIIDHSVLAGCMSFRWFEDGDAFGLQALRFSALPFHQSSLKIAYPLGPRVFFYPQLCLYACFLCSCAEREEFIE